MPRNGVKSRRERLNLSKKQSNGGVARLRLHSEDELALIRIISELDKLNDAEDKSLIPASLLSTLKVAVDDSNDSGSESTDDNSDSDESERSDVDAFNSDIDDESSILPNLENSLFKDSYEPELSSNMDKVVKIVQPLAISEDIESLSTKLIRDERKQVKLGSAVPTRAEKSLFVRSVYSTNSNKSLKISSTEKANVISQINKKLPSMKKLPASVLLEVYCQGKDPSFRKAIVVNRADDVADITSMIRKKFNATKKHDVLYVSHPLHGITLQSKILTQEELSKLPDSTAITLAKSSVTSVVPDQKEEANAIYPVENIPDDINLPVCGVKEATDSDEFDVTSLKITGETLTTVPAVWKPPRWSRTLEDEVLGATNQNLECDLNMKIYQENLFNDPNHASMLATRRSLPIYEKRKELLDLICNNRVVVVSGQTGSGKSTQLPNYILEDRIEKGHFSETFIVCTQPRRIATMAVAERIAQERKEVVGHVVGFQIRLNSRLSATTKILFCTTGVLLNRIQNPNFLGRVSHVIIDEVHERQVETDFLMTILKDRLDIFPNFKLVLMSATLEEQSVAAYFNCPIVYVSGRMYPVQDHFLDETLKFITAKKSSALPRPGVDLNDRRAQYDKTHSIVTDFKSAKPGYYHKHPAFYDVLAALVSSIIGKFSGQSTDRGDSILIFLSGIDAIKKTQSALRRIGVENAPSINVLILHSSLPPDQQRRVFRQTRPGEWKIILATNIAETSITVDDVTHVIDLGLMKEVRYDADVGLSSLKEVLISRASSRQRAGRAGRVRPGHCWKFYTEAFFDSSSFADFPVPEICRVPLEEVVLQVLLLELGLPESFLGRCLQPPSLAQIRASVSLLLEINAILPQPSLPLTPLGYHLARIPMDVRLGKMLIVSTILGAVDSALTVCAALCGKSPFLAPPDKLVDASKAQAKFLEHISDGDKFTVYSDHLAALNAFDTWQRIRKSQGYDAALTFCKKNFLSPASLDEIANLRINFKRHLSQAGFLGDLSSEELEEDNNDDISELDHLESSDAHRVDLTLCCLCAGLSPNIARVSRYVERGFETKKGKGKGRRDLLPTRITQSDGKEVYLHPSSKLCRQLSSVLDSAGSPNAFLVYHKKMATDKINLFDASLVPLPTILLFGGELAVNKTKGTVLLNGWLQAKVSELHAVIFKRLQREIEKLLQGRVDSDSTSAVKNGIRQQLVLQAINIFLGSKATDK